MERPGTPWNALSVVSGALGELSRAPLKFLSVRHVQLRIPLGRDWSATTSFPNDIISGISHFWTLRFLFHSLYITIPPYLKSTKLMRKLRECKKRNQMTKDSVCLSVSHWRYVGERILQKINGRCSLPHSR